MERRPFIAGNWKMHKTISEGLQMVNKLKPLVMNVKDVDIAISASYIMLKSLADALQGTNIAVAAQNLYWEKEGAFTGEVSSLQLLDAGCEYVIIGHSERRAYFQETDEMVNKKVKAALQGGLKPIMCVGETLHQREAGTAFTVVGSQLRGGLAGVRDAEMLKTTLAYEPVWAIGTGKTATPEQAQEIHAHIRKLLGEIFGADIANQVRIQYGGSVKPSNVDDLMSMPDIDGALVGGAAQEAESFARLVKFEKK